MTIPATVPLGSLLFDVEAGVLSVLVPFGLEDVSPGLGWWMGVTDGVEAAGGPLTGGLVVVYIWELVVPLSPSEEAEPGAETRLGVATAPPSIVSFVPLLRTTLKVKTLTGLEAASDTVVKSDIFAMMQRFLKHEYQR